MRVSNRTARRRWGTALLALVMIEAAILGSGRLVTVGPLTLKMLLFGIAQTYVVYRLVASQSRLKISTLILVGSLFTLISVAAVIGITNGASASSVAEDIKPLSYFCAIAFFELTIRTQEHIRLVLRLFKVAAVLLSLGYFIIVASVYLGVLPFEVLYDLLKGDEGGDFMFRGSDGLFFYKGALYIGVGVILFAYERRMLSRLALGLGIAALLFTDTRGFFIALGAVVATYILTEVKHPAKKAFYCTLGLAFAIAVYLWFSASAGDREASDQVRANTINQVLDDITPASAVLGHGFGIGVPERPVHMESAFLEIFHKQGIIGIAWWLGVLVILCIRYRKASRKDNPYAGPLFLCALFVVFESLTNPFMNNPIGMTVWMVALVGLDVVTTAQLPLATSAISVSPQHG